MAGADFLSMVLVIVYVGAVTVLFLFIVMTIGDSTPAYNTKKSYWIFGFLAGGLLALELLIGLGSLNLTASVQNLSYKIPMSQIHSIGSVLYTSYFLPFQMSGMILLSAMIGAIILTHRTNPKAKRQSGIKQSRRAKNINLVEVPLRKEFRLWIF